MMESPPLLNNPAMQPVIRRLPNRLVNQIAAGEVVTRPAAALKELIENSLDAGATRIEISVEEDALGFTVRDDGCGMDEENLRLCVERYATSKIREIEDLTRLGTRGFRGEALAAISAVARLEILTRARGATEGLRLRMSGGQDVRVAPAAANEGTTIVVRDLFFNTPVRLKFLKNAVAEWGHMLQAMLRQGLTRPDVAFAIRWRGKPYLDLPAGQSLIDRLAQILPGGAGGDLLPVDHVLHEVRVHGAVSGPKTTRRDRRHQYFFANGRPIFYRPLPFAMEEAYRGLVMTQQYPLGALLIEMPGELVDVNVHPTKEEVRFQNEALVGGAVHRAVSEALRAANLVPTLNVAMPGRKPPAPLSGTGLSASDAATPPEVGPQRTVTGAEDRPAPFALTRETLIASGLAPRAEGLDFLPGFALPEGAPAGQGADAAREDRPRGGAAEPQPYADPHEREEADLLARLRALPAPPRALAQVGLTYILAEAGEGALLMIDQHAAHEKIMYLKICGQAERGGAGIEVQPLLVPHQLEVAPAEAATLEGLIPALREAGFDVEPFGERSFIVQAAPLLFERLDVPAFLRDLIDDVGQGDLPRELERLRGRIHARAACRAAVKAGDALTLPEMQRVVDQLMETHAILRCPHGRPTTLLLTRDHIDRQFGRI